MPPAVIDLISSSPPPTSKTDEARAGVDRQQQQQQQPHHAGQRRPSAEGRPAAAAAAADVTAQGVIVADLTGLSDFDCSEDDFDLLTAARPPAKRQRTTSPSRPAPAAMAVQALSSRPPLIVGRQAQPGRRDLEAIEVSSSMEQPTPDPKQRGGDALSRLTVPPMSSDPFASSPEPAAAPALSRREPVARSIDPPPKRRRSMSVDPFESSPMPSRPRPEQHAKAPAAPLRSRLLLEPDFDPFESSPEPDDAPAAAKDPHTATSPPSPVSLSPTSHNLQPAASRSHTSARAFTRVLSETNVISIDDSGSDSDDSEGSDLADIASIDVTKRPLKPRSPLRRSRSDNIIGKSRLNATARRPGARSTVDKAAREADKEAEKERKRRERERKKEEKAREKERAAALAEVNKLRTDKKVSTPEMIVDLPACLAPDHKVQVETLLEGLDVQFSTWDSGDNPIIKWRRKVKSRFDEDLGRWEPIPAHIRDENHVLAIVNADDFVKLAMEDGLDSHVGSIKERFPRHSVLYLLQGMTPWLRKNRNLRNRQFASGVRAGRQAAATTTNRSRSAASSAEFVSEDAIEDALLRLQVEHDVFIHHTTVSAETARWVATFTQHISTIPYRRQRDHATAAAGFCMESGQVRTGEDARDTYVKMLQEIVRITAPIAYGVAAEFDSVSKLVRGLEAGGPERLDKVHKGANKDGQLSDRTIGPAVSRRICKVFTGRDEASTDV
ncbi:alpha-1,2-mannosyltransferase (Alg2) [Purpureocillium lavendulum]|uniref:Alpha-1,2-mannosyltransferase (Alg2) n=1 Tax=Purpureocillium lavendulum TaxID=1247861 RepID=A0AB34FJN9_9HYPO|nr:alpha-1,2-mannosyltransferase (Alg2) [Purpureocillium lavendulum]